MCTRVCTKIAKETNRFAKASWCKRIKGFEIYDRQGQSAVYCIGIEVYPILFLAQGDTENGIAERREYS